MRKHLVLILAVAFITAFLSSWCVADNFPAQQQAPAARQAPAQPRIAEGQTFYGYVPPPQIRHTWPGGYKVIFHELTNTLMEHILGQY
jgi:hypothetical protein